MVCRVVVRGVVVLGSGWGCGFRGGWDCGFRGGWDCGFRRLAWGRGFGSGRGWASWFLGVGGVVRFRGGWDCGRRGGWGCGFRGGNGIVVLGGG